MVLEAERVDEGGAPPDTVWRYLGRLELHPPAGGVTVAADADNRAGRPSRGRCRPVFARYGEDAEVAALKLVRGKEGGTTWEVDPREVERTFRIRKVDPEAKVRGK